MELLNNLWIALSTPNENLLNIITIPFFLLEAFLMLSLFTSILNIRASKKQKIIYILSTSIVSIISTYFLPSVVNVFSNYIIAILLVYFIFKLSIFKSIVSITISVLILNLVGGLTLNPFITLLHIDNTQLTTIPIYRLLYITLLYSIVAIIILIIKSKKWKIVFIDSVDKKSKLIVFFNLLLGIITLLVQTLLAAYYINTLPEPTILIG